MSERKAISVDVLDVPSHMTAIHLLTGVPDLLKHMPGLLSRMRERDGGLYNLLECIVGEKAHATELDLPKALRNKTVSSYQERRGAIRLCVVFPCIPPKPAFKLMNVSVECVRSDPWVLARKRVLEKSNMLHVADTVAKQHIGPCTPEPNDNRRVIAYIVAAITFLRDEHRMLSDELNVHKSSTWFPRASIVDCTMGLLDEGPPVWKFARSDVETVFDTLPLHTRLAVDHTSTTGPPLFTLSTIDQAERTVARILHSVDTTVIDERAIAVFEHLKQYRTLMMMTTDPPASIVETVETWLNEHMGGGWRLLYERMRPEKVDDEQISAIEMLLRHRIVAIVGHAGVGKTSTLSFVIHFMKQVLGAKQDLRCVAPTGKASARLRVLLSTKDIQVSSCRTPNPF